MEPIKIYYPEEGDDLMTIMIKKERTRPLTLG